MGQLYAVEIIYRGVFQKTLAKNITRGLVLAAHREGKPGISFGRYGDSPERNGIPAKGYAIVASDEETLQLGMAHYEQGQVDVSVVLDETLAGGIESWAWDGVHAVNANLKPGGTLIFVSTQDAESLVERVQHRAQPYKLGILRGLASFSGMWVFKDDHTDVRVLGAIAKAAPALVSFAAIEGYVQEKIKNATKLVSARNAYERFTAIEVAPGQGNAEPLRRYTLPQWQDMRLGTSISGQPQGGPIEDPVTHKLGGFRPARNDRFLKYTTRSQRPVINFETCTKCTLCWLNCPDASFDVTPEGTYDANLSACCGCGICQEVCPVEHCITMVSETAFHNNDSQWAAYRQDKCGYLEWLGTTIATAEAEKDRSHGFRYRGQYAEQVPQALEIAKNG